MSGQSSAKTVFDFLEVYVQWSHNKVAISFWGSPLLFSSSTLKIDPKKIWVINFDDI